ncbi:MAG TPA: alpha/beta hydrolase [Desulfitobacteriaceae bacterium]|nr:alpha/beta hydrolase [Desulfitobacteriaceae bacterium]
MNLYDFRYNIDFFFRQFKVYAFDMVGCGFTDKPKASYSPEYFVRFINEVMNFYNIEKASFLASSWGGGHVLYFALKYPDQVKKFILSSPCGIPHKMINIFALLGILLISNIIMLFISKAVTKFIISSMIYHKELVDKILLIPYIFLYLTKGCISSTVKSYMNANFTFVRKNLEMIAAPVLLVWGTRDSVHEKWMMDEMKNRLKNSNLYTIENVGHLPHEEAFDEFNKHALEFLNG